MYLSRCLGAISPCHQNSIHDQGNFQSTGSAPWRRKSWLALLNGRVPKNPL
jgi:hypothetical protein